MKFVMKPFFLLRPFFEWTTRYPLICVLTAGLMAILGGFDGGMGLRFLFLEGSPFSAGLAVAVVLFEVCFVCYLLDSDEPWMRPNPVDADSLEQYRIRYLAITVGLLATLAFGMATAGSAGGLPMMFTLGLITGVASVAFFSRIIGKWIDQAYSTLLLPFWQRSKNSAESNGLSRSLVTIANWVVKPPKELQLSSIHTRGAVAGVLIAFTYSLLVLTRPSWVSAAVAICVLLGLVAAIYGYLRFNFPRRFFGAFLFLAIWVTSRVGSETYLHRFPKFEARHYDSPTSLARADQPNDDLLSDTDVLLRWKELAGAPEEAAENEETYLEMLPRLVVVSTSGGGIRAGVWTANVLAQLEREIKDFPRHLRLVTGASGGMYGASYYVKTLNPPDSKESHEVPLDKVISNVAASSLGKVARELVLGDVPHYLAGATDAIGARDRGTALESAWQENTQGGFAMPFSNLKQGEADGWRPSLIVSPMMSDDGRRLLFSNLNLGRLTQSKGFVLDQGVADYSVNAIEFYKLFPDVDVQLSTAIRMNASFPYVSPDGVLPTVPPRRIVDAGYYDNFGVNVAAAWLFQRRQWLAQHTSGVLLIQIRDSKSAVTRRKPEATPSAVNGPIERGLSWITTPFTAVMSARNSTNSFRNDEELQSLQTELQNSRVRAWKKHFKKMFGNENRVLPASGLNDVRSFFVTTALELDEEVSLSWTLTDNEINRISESASRKEIQARITKIDDWLHKQ